MDLTQQNKTYYGRSLEEVLTSFYSAGALREIYEQLIEPHLDAQARAVKLNKAILVSRFMDQLGSEEGVRAFIKRLPRPVYEAINHLLWKKCLLLSDLRDLLGEPVATLKAPHDRRRYGDIAYQLSGAAQLLAIKEESSGSFYLRRDDPGEEHYEVSLPPAISQLLMEYFPKPVLYDWQPVKELPRTGTSFDCSAHMATDLAVLADYLHRANTVHTKQGKLGKAVLRSMAALTAGGDFLTASDKSKALELARHDLLGHLLEELPDAFLQGLREHPFPAATVLPELVPQLCRNPAGLMRFLTPHLKVRDPFYEPDYNDEGLQRLFGVFSSLPTGEWVSAKNLIAYVWLRQIPILYFPWHRYRFKPADSSPARKRGYFGGAVDLDHDNVFEAAVVPTLLGAAFLLAALGVLEIHYTAPPAHPAWHIGKENFLTRWDGLLALRLTSVGAYCFGLSKTLDLELPRERDNAIRFNGPRLLAFSRTDDPVTRQTLEDFLDRVGPGVYRFSAPKLFKGCFEKPQLAGRIADFRTRMDVDLPAEWEAALADLLNAPAPLQRESGYTVYQIPDVPRLRQLFATDPLLREACLRVQGWRVAVHADNVKRVREHLRSLGYFLEGNVDSAPVRPKKKAPTRRRRWRGY